MMRLAITQLAEQDIETICDYIAKGSPSQALTFMQELREQCQLVLDNPQNYRRRPEVDDGLQSCAYGHYVIFFEVVEKYEYVLIIRVMHGAHDLPTALVGDEE